MKPFIQRTLLIGLLSLPTAFSYGSCQEGVRPGLGRGFHLGEAFGRTSDDYKAMSTAGASLVRFGIALKACKGCDAYERPTRALDELFRNLDLAKATGMRVVVVLRPPPDPESELWVNSSLQNSLDDLWRSLAVQLRGHPEVAAFDLVNEPHPRGFTFAMKESKWNELATRLIHTIRAADSSRTIVYEPSPGARPMAFKYVQKLPFDNIVYSTHFYEPFEFTHQRTGDQRFMGVVSYPGVVADQGVWNAARLKDVLAPVKKFADSNGVEIYVGEFGAVRWAPAGAREGYLQDLSSLFSSYAWSWTYHAYREWHGWDAEIGVVEGDHRRHAEEPAFVLLKDALNECGKHAGNE